jgi:hypothetical protein
MRLELELAGQSRKIYGGSWRRDGHDLSSLRLAGCLFVYRRFGTRKKGLLLPRGHETEGKKMGLGWRRAIAAE